MTTEKSKDLVNEKDRSLITKTVGLVAHYKEMQILTDDDATKAAQILSDAKTTFKQLEEKRKAKTDPLREKIKLISDEYKPATEACEQVERLIKDKMAVFMTAKREAERKEAARLADEQMKQKQLLEEKAEKMREVGKEEQAELIEQKAATQVFSTTVAPTKIAGVGGSEKWEFEVVNVKHVLQLIIDDQIPLSAVKLSQPELNKVANQWKGTKEFKGLKYISGFQVRSYKK